MAKSMSVHEAVVLYIKKHPHTKNVKKELVRLFNPKSGSLIALMSDGEILRKTLLGEWKLWRRYKKEWAFTQAEMTTRFFQFYHDKQGFISSAGIRQPSLHTMERWAMDGVAKATDGCRVEPDGQCPHGFQSWLITAGII